MVYCCSFKKWLVHVTMTQEDDYDFSKTSVWIIPGVRNRSSYYKAANELQMTYGYPPFWHSETWDDKFWSK
jgi:hypothetical protein